MEKNKLPGGEKRHLQSFGPDVGHFHPAARSYIAHHEGGGGGSGLSLLKPRRKKMLVELTTRKKNLPKGPNDIIHRLGLFLVPGGTFGMWNGTGGHSLAVARVEVDFWGMDV